MHKTHIIFLVNLITFFLMSSLSAQEVLFDFDNVPLYTSLPIDITVSGITAHLSATSPGYSIQNADVLGFTPPGFAGHILYPNSINLSDIFIKYDNVLTDFSIMYSPDELGCDNSATMRVTAYINGNFVGTDTRTATFPGTWPVDTLRCSFPQGFDSVVVHYDSPPPTCQDYGTIFMADNMRVTPLNVNGISEIEFPEMFMLSQNYPNPFNPSTNIRLAISSRQFVSIKVYDVLGNEIATLVNQQKPAGIYEVEFDATGLPSGVYFYQLKAGPFLETKKMVLMK
jgi:Secretion system C-terminal sorting domain